MQRSKHSGWVRQDPEIWLTSKPARVRRRAPVFATTPHALQLPRGPAIQAARIIMHHNV